VFWLLIFLLGRHHMDLHIHGTTSPGYLLNACSVMLDVAFILEDFALLTALVVTCSVALTGDFAHV